MSLLEKMRGDRKGWYKVSDLKPGVEIAVPRTSGGSQTSNSDPRSLTSSDVLWDEIVSITPVGREHVYDIEVEDTHNFIGNGIFAHNTYVLRANTMLAVEGEVHAGSFTVPASTAEFTIGTSTLTAEIPSAVLTADGKGVDLYKLSTYNLAGVQMLAARMDAEEVRVTSLETRVEKLESGAISSASGNVGIGSSTLASVFEGFGAFIGKGFAQFGTLIADRFVAATNSAGTSSAGTVTMLTGNTVAQVTNAYVTPATKIFVTFNSQITGSWWVSDKAAGSFRVVLSAAQTTDVSFDYFLVQTEGQIATSTPPFLLSRETPKSGTSGTTAPAISLLGDNPLHISVGGTYVEPGITIRDSAGGAISTYTTFVNGVQQSDAASAINTGSDATYLIMYKATDAAGNTGTATRSVIVGAGSGASGGSSSSTDKIAPVVTLAEGTAMMQLTVGDAFTDPGATATDTVDGDLTAKIIVTGTVDIKTAGSYTLTYTATDKAGNIGSVSRTVIVAAGDTTKPVITLNGAAPMSLTVGDTFTDPGATATDDTDGAITPVVTGTVDPTTAGSYTITYTATDKAGNTSTASRSVTVAPAI